MHVTQQIYYEIEDQGEREWNLYRDSRGVSVVVLIEVVIKNGWPRPAYTRTTAPATARSASPWRETEEGRSRLQRMFHPCMLLVLLRQRC